VAMEDDVIEIIKPLFNDIDNWKIDQYRVTHITGVSIWVAHGFLHLSVSPNDCGASYGLNFLQKIRLSRLIKNLVKNQVKSKVDKWKK
jgi:hypothetical protein